jgi:hypothetical protein
MQRAAFALWLLSTLSLVGCEKEKVVDIEAPGVDVEVDEDGETRIGTDE